MFVGEENIIQRESLLSFSLLFLDIYLAFWSFLLHVSGLPFFFTKIIDDSEYWQKCLIIKPYPFFSIPGVPGFAAAMIRHLHS